ncbi:hypothetical protein T265_02741 [Opisthorchis viverrini]|uniref:Uncharacterized protein n=1 Tax=Opisthorchis viverrini TaxID=6198 RepID=A0A075AI32_OPIVI|nr:hypothetical protein T265_02741 [Opisthorchis viverrini]KER30929.1 hypothetical protein T265_02741 [Opisthorchis viverrini]
MGRSHDHGKEPALLHCGVVTRRGSQLSLCCVVLSSFIRALKQIQDTQEAIIGLFSTLDSSNPHLQHFLRASHVEKDRCSFHIIHGLMLADEPIEVVDKFVYLGSCIGPGGFAKDDISIRIGKARAAFADLRHLWPRRDISFSVKGRVYNAACLAIDVFGALSESGGNTGSAILNIVDEGDKMAHREAVSQRIKEITTMKKANFQAIHSWIVRKCTLLVRELTFANAEEITDEALPLLLLFYDKESEHLKPKFHEVVNAHLSSHLGQINFLTADGNTFSHPLAHMGKSAADLPFFCIDSLVHMYAHPKKADVLLRSSTSSDWTNKLFTAIKCIKLAKSLAAILSQLAPHMHGSTYADDEEEIFHVGRSTNAYQRAQVECRFVIGRVII